MKLTRFSKQIIAVVCAIALVIAGFAFAPSSETKADDYSELTFKVSDNNPDLAVAFVTQGGVTTTQEVNYCLDQGNNFYCATTAAFTKPNFKTVTCNGNVEDPARGGANFWVPMNVLNDNAYNLVTIEDADGNTAQFVIRKGTPVTPTESQSVDPSAPTTTTEEPSTPEPTTKTPTVLPDFPNLDWQTTSNMYTDVAYCVVEHTIKGWGHMNFYNTDYMQFIGSGDSKFNEASYEVLNSSGTDITSSVQPFENGAAVVGVNIRQKLGTSDEYYLFTFDNPDTGRLQVAIRIGNPGGETTEPYTGETTTTALQVPGAPVGLVANIINNNTTVYVAHGPASGTVTGYKYYLDDVEDNRFFNGCNVPVSQFNAGQTYTVKVTAYNDAGEGPAATATFTIPYPAGWYDVSTYKSTTPYTYPTQEGKLFAGWFTDETCTTEYTATTGYAYAKFIDEKVLTMKFQVANDGSAVRFISSLDSDKYSQIGFNFTGTYGNAVISAHTKTTNSLYNKITAAGESMLPTVFSNESNYFFTYTVRGMTNASTESTWNVTPFFVTLDGTTVTGKAGTYPVEDTPPIEDGGEI